MYIRVILSRLTLRMDGGTDRRETEILKVTNCADPIFGGKLPGTSVAGYGRKILLLVGYRRDWERFPSADLTPLRSVVL